MVMSSCVRQGVLPGGTQAVPAARWQSQHAQCGRHKENTERMRNASISDCPATRAQLVHVMHVLRF